MVESTGSEPQEEESIRVSEKSLHGCETVKDFLEHSDSRRIIERLFGSKNGGDNSEIADMDARELASLITASPDQLAALTSFAQRTLIIKASNLETGHKLHERIDMVSRLLHAAFCDGGDIERALNFNLRDFEQSMETIEQVVPDGSTLS